MRLLFVHQNFPGQFKHLAPALARAGHEVRALAVRGRAGERHWQGVRIHDVGVRRGSTPGIHPWVQDLETKVIRGEAAFHAARTLAEEGFAPEAIIAHPGWGESLFLKEVWPDAPLGIYCEFYYLPRGADTGFDPEFDRGDPAAACRLRMKNANNHLHFDLAAAGISPTYWQASTFPLPFRARIAVIHDGIDTARLAPDPTATFARGSLALSRADEVVTFVNRNLEPTRGYHRFMRALPRLLRERPGARVVIVGGDEVSYGARPPAGKTWKQIFIEEVRPQISDDHWARVHFVGRLPYGDFVRLLQVSTVHVYLTYPFVLSWSLLEAMSLGCAIVASDTAPVREAIRHGETGLLVDFFDADALVEAVVRLLVNSEERARLGANARRFAAAHYDLERVCLPRQLAWVNALAARVYPGVEG